MKLMGGTIDVDSKVGEGAKFTVCLTLRRDPDADSYRLQEAGKGLACDLAGTHILLAEDNEINAEIAIILLEDMGAEVERADNGKEAVDLLAASPAGTYALILMDVQMPVMDGLMASRTIRGLEHPDAKHIPIVGLSANAFQEDMKTAQENGMNAYLSKPLDLKRLCLILNQFIGR